MLNGRIVNIFKITLCIQRLVKYLQHARYCFLIGVSSEYKNLLLFVLFHSSQVLWGAYLLLLVGRLL